MKYLPTLLLALLIIPAGPVFSEDEAQTDPNTPSALWKASVAAEGKKDYQVALLKVREFTKAGGDPFLANLRGGWLEYLAQDYKEAREYYARATRLQSSAISPLIGQLNVAQAEGDSNEIRKAVAGVLHSDPLNYRAQMAGAGLQFKAKNYREALSYYRRVVQYYPEDTDALSGEAWSYFYLGQPQQAFADFKILLSIDPDYQDAKKGLELTQIR